MNIIISEFYKLLRQKVFIISIMLIIFVSVLYPILINRNIDNNSNLLIESKLTKDEYISINKYGNYKSYIDYYDIYKDKVTEYNKNINNDSFSILLNKSRPILYFIAIFLILLSYHIYAYDYSNGTLKYVYQGEIRKKIFNYRLLFIILVNILLYILSIFIIINISSILISTIEYKLALNFFIESLLYIMPAIFISIVSITLSNLFKGSSVGLIITLIIYLFSSTITVLLLNNGINIVEYTFLPYLDYSYFENINNIYNNLIYNLSTSLYNSIYIFSINIIILYFINIILIKKDI